MITQTHLKIPPMRQRHEKLMESSLYPALVADYVREFDKLNYLKPGVEYVVRGVMIK